MSRTVQKQGGWGEKHQPSLRSSKVSQRHGLWDAPTQRFTHGNGHWLPGRETPTLPAHGCLRVAGEDPDEH